MPASLSVQLEDKIKRLLAERKEHLEAVAEIDAVFARFGIKAGSAKPAARRGRPAGTKRRGRPKSSGGRKRGRPKGSAGGVRGRKAGIAVAKGPRARAKRSGPTGAESVLAFVTSKGEASTGEIVANWKAEGRAGVPNPTMSGLIKAKKLKKAKRKGVQGSVFSLA